MVPTINWPPSLVRTAKTKYNSKIFCSTKYRYIPWISFYQTALLQISGKIYKKEFHRNYHYLNAFLPMKFHAIKFSIETAKWTNRDKQVFLQIFLQCLSLGRRCDGQICVRFRWNLTGVLISFYTNRYYVYRTGNMHRPAIWQSFSQTKQRLARYETK